MIYDPTIGRDSMCRLFECDSDDLGVVDYEIQWDTLEENYARLYVIIEMVIERLLALDRRGHGFLIEWWRVLEHMCT